MKYQLAASNTEAGNLPLKELADVLNEIKPGLAESPYVGEGSPQVRSR